MAIRLDSRESVVTAPPVVDRPVDRLVDRLEALFFFFRELDFLEDELRARAVSTAAI
jgi:hypothetical protein